MSYEEEQLELFRLSEGKTLPFRHGAGRALTFRIRYDQLMLVGIAGLIGVAVIFAGGVERGKQLTRSERVVLARTAPEVEAIVVPARSTESPSRAVAPEVLPTKATAPSTSKSRYAIQVVTYNQSRLAKQELQRLQAKGERAFLVMRNGRTILYVGPFPSQERASEKLSALKSRYQDCFIRTL